MFDRTFLIRLVKARMPYGRFRNRFITELPVSYLEWIHRTGYPSGNLGQYLSTMHEIKTNGLDYLLDPIILTQRNNR